MCGALPKGFLDGPWSSQQRKQVELPRPSRNPLGQPLSVEALSGVNIHLNVLCEYVLYWCLKGLPTENGPQQLSSDSDCLPTPTEIPVDHAALPTVKQNGCIQSPVLRFPSSQRTVLHVDILTGNPLHQKITYFNMLCAAILSLQFALPLPPHFCVYCTPPQMHFHARCSFTICCTFSRMQISLPPSTEHSPHCQIQSHCSFKTSATSILLPPDPATALLPLHFHSHCIETPIALSLTMVFSLLLPITHKAN